MPLSIAQNRAPSIEPLRNSTVSFPFFILFFCFHLIFNLTQNLPLAVGEGRKREFYFSKKERNCHNTDGEGIEKGEIIDWSPRDSGAVRRTESTMFSTFYSDQVMKFFPLYTIFSQRTKRKRKKENVFFFFFPTISSLLCGSVTSTSPLRRFLARLPSLSRDTVYMTEVIDTHRLGSQGIF